MTLKTALWAAVALLLAVPSHAAEDVTCKTCGKRFEIPSHRNVVFLEELEGLPKEDYDE